MASKFYVVWQGRKTGIFTDWPSTQAAVSGFTGAQYKSYKSKAEAEIALKKGYRAAVGAPAKAASKGSGSKSSKKAANWTAPDTDVVIYCDGACDPNPGKAGTGLALYVNGKVTQLWFGLYEPRGTNNTAELHGLHQALQLAAKAHAQNCSVSICSDSSYGIKAISEWADGWKKRGWKRAGGEIKNLELIQACYALWQELKNVVEVRHVPGHAGIEGNELADRMSVHAVAEQESGFSRYPEPFELNTVLAMRAG